MQLVISLLIFSVEYMCVSQAFELFTRTIYNMNHTMYEGRIHRDFDSNILCIFTNTLKKS